MRTKNVGLIVLISLMMALPMAVVQADPIDEWDEFVVIAGMKLRHKELRDLDTEDWVFSLGTIQNPSKYYWYRDVTVTDSSNQYDLEWTGRLYWSIFTREWSYEYEDYYVFNVTVFGDGSTDPEPGMHYIKPGDNYTFTAKPHASGSINYKYVLDYWDVTDGVTSWQVKNRVLTGEAVSDLNITAVYRRASTHTCNVWYEDGLNSWTLWQKRHVPITVWMPFGPKYVTITVESDYGLYSRTFYVDSKDMCVFFSAQRFVGDYTVTVSAVDSTGPLTTDHFVAIT